MKLEDLKKDDKKVLTSAQRKSLEQIGITTVELLANSTKREIEALSGFGEKSSERAWRTAIDVMLPRIFIPGDELHRERIEKVEYLTTGSKNLDKLIGGGVETGSITEIAGGFGSGKTELCFQLSVNAYLPKERGGLGGPVIYFDTEGTWRGVRLLEMGEALNFQDHDVLKNIRVAKCYSSDHQVVLLDQVDRLIKELGVKLIVVDSLMAHFRAEYVGRGVLAPRQQAINNYMRKLARMASAFNLAVVVTNQAVSSPGFISFTKPTGGNVVAHASTTRLWIRRPSTMKEQRIVRLLESPWLPVGEAVIKISGDGIRDVKEDA